MCIRDTRCKLLPGPGCSKMRYPIILFFLFLPLAKPFAQSGVLDKTVSGKFQDITLFDLFQEFEKQSGAQFCYEPEKLPWYKLDFEYRDVTLYKALGSLLPKHGLTFAKLNDQLYAICRPAELNAPYLRDLSRRWLAGEIKMPEFLSPLKRDVAFGAPPAAATELSISGMVRDDETKEAIIGASVSVDSIAGGVSTNAIGQFSLKLPPGIHTLHVRYLGYRETIIRLSAYENGSLEAPLAPQPQALREVVIEGNKANNKVQNVLTGVEALSAQTIKELPSFLGEADVVKSLSTLAGVTSAGDGASGFNVRGGNVDQNLTLQDDAPLFNTAHVLGFFSVYNPDLVRNVTLYKGHVPAQFGGRSSSVLDVRLREGHFTEHHGQIGAGIAAGKLTLEGPIWKNKISYLLGVRRSYSDWLLRASPIAEGRSSSAWFFDGLAKISARMSEKTTLSVTAYGTNDFFRYGQLFGYEWRNRLLNATLKHPLGANIVSTWQANYGRYTAGNFVPAGLDAFDLSGGLEYQNISWRNTWIPSSGHELVGGLQWNRTRSIDESLSPRGDKSIVQPRRADKDRGEEWALFVQDEMRAGDHLTVSAGLRSVFFRNLGEKTLYRYQDGKPRTTEFITDSVFYASGETVKWYYGLEPRLSLSYKLNAHSAVKFSYNRMRQYIHLISNLVSPTPVDVWQVSNPYIRPQTGDNFDLGYSLEWGSRSWEGAADLFYKNTRDVPVFKDFPDLLLNEHLETELLRGNSDSYGAETTLKKRSGRWTGWLTYTYARTWLRTPSGALEGAVSKGQRFPSDFDQPHQMNAYAKFAWNPASSISFNCVYRTGRPVSAPTGVYSVGGVVVPRFELRNNARIPDYFRLDLSLNFDQNKSKIAGLRTSLNISVYNVLARKNPYSVFFRKTPNSYPKAYAFSVVGTAIPAITLNLTF